LEVAWLLEVELTAAIEHCVFVARTTGQFRITPEAAGAAHALFAEDMEQENFLATVALDEDALKDTAKELALRHTARRGFRTYDLLYVSSALLLGCDTFWSFDAKARELATAEGLALNALTLP
jgi:predicted nucleic acid-binding protein